MELKEHERRHLEKMYPYMGEFVVLLKKNGDFPLKEAGEIALYGNGGRFTIKGGTGSGEVNSRFFINCEEGLKERGFIVKTASWLDGYDEARKKLKEEFNKGLKKAAKKQGANWITFAMGKVLKEGNYELPIEKECDTAIYVLSRISGEGSDREAKRGDYLLSETEIKDLRKLHERYDKLMLVLNTGGPVDLSEVDFVENILVLSQLGVQTGDVLADILLGKLYPSGKLATTWDKYENYCHEGDFDQINDTSYKEGIYVGYRYFDSIGKKALYPFGYGLGYADITVKAEDVSLKGSVVNVDVLFTNTSKEYCGKQTAQLYLSKPSVKLDQPYQELCAFQKSDELKPLTSQKMSLHFDLRDLASYDTEKETYVLEQGDYILRVGTSSVETEAIAVIEVKEEVVVRKVHNCLGEVDFKDLSLPSRKEELPKDLKHLVLDPSSISCEVIDYEKDDPICEELKGESPEKLALLNIGAFDPKAGFLSVIGSAAMSVAGAAGESSDVFTEKGLRKIVMADGPAGLRLSKEFFKDEKGAHGLGSSLPETILAQLPHIIRFIINRMNRIPKNVDIFEQWCTAIPIGTAIAQSFNEDLACMLGDIVGEEMEIYGVDLWLAPALNIHRDVLCGRNFEYFSEDPLVSGVMAAAITKGVQSHPGKGVTIKHFAANNQEFNRYYSNSKVSERALREIYLRGFEYCIKKEKPYAVMSSYNLLNGIHTSEHQGLCVDVLRREWNYDGILMTDWIIGRDMSVKGSIYPMPDPVKVAASSHSLYMPGSKKDYEKLLNGVRDNKFSLKQLEVNGSRLFRLFKEEN
ncbi:MAG: glycoside hydrolase family 3 C-terminal domain-containing protein [Erysipelotrichaceae bacterium]|nr:glycoside hydrolase family 3 C-terminal domain-containing protein [Erysipelotrichaceae bacterium]